MVARHVLRQSSHRDRLQTAYVDCWEHYDEYHLLSRVVDRLGIAVVHENSTPKRALVDALQDDTDSHRVVVLDELEMVHDPAPLKQLACAPQLDVVAIVNDPTEIKDIVEGAWGDLPDRQFLQFRPYSVTRLAAILSKRAELGLRDGLLSTRTTERIAEAAGGDARLGICIVRAAAEHAAEARADQITDDHIAAGVETAEQELHQTMLNRLTDHQRTLYQIVREAGELEPSEIETEYERRIDDTRSRKTMQTYLSKMEHYGLLKATGTTHDRTYRVDTSGYVESGEVV
jgi:Cdc6-like AAA superfamily ATPase